MVEIVEPVPDELPFTDVQLAIERCVGMLAGRPLHCGRSAFSHLRRAWRLHGIDNEMSLFRAITAEEEAATALILALKARQYPGSERLDHRKHEHKAGIAPFLEEVAKVLGSMEFVQPRIHLSSKESKPRIDVSMSAAIAGITEEPDQRMSPDEPFNFVARESLDGAPDAIMTFANQLGNLASDKGAGQILDFIRKEANVRNLVLYAQDTGIPAVDFQKSLILGKLRRVCVILQVTIGILQTPIRQLFAVQCLEAYLGALRRLPEQGFNFDEEEPMGDQNRYIVRKMDDGPPVTEVEVTRQVRFESIVVTDQTIAINMTGLNDGLAYRVDVQEANDTDAITSDSP